MSPEITLAAYAAAFILFASNPKLAMLLGICTSRAL